MIFNSTEVLPGTVNGKDFWDCAPVPTDRCFSETISFLKVIFLWITSLDFSRYLTCTVQENIGDSESMGWSPQDRRIALRLTPPGRWYMSAFLDGRFCKPRIRVGRFVAKYQYYRTTPAYPKSCQSVFRRYPAVDPSDNVSIIILLMEKIRAFFWGYANFENIQPGRLSVCRRTSSKKAERVLRKIKVCVDSRRISFCILH